MSSGQQPDQEKRSGRRAQNLLDRLTTVDDEVERSNEFLESIDQQIGQFASVLQQQNQILSALANALGEDVDLRLGNEFPFLLSAEVPPDTPPDDPLKVSFSETPYDARLSRVVVNFPDATQQAAGVSVGRPGGVTWIPRGGKTFTQSAGELDNPTFIGLNDTTVTFNPNVEVDEGDPIEARYANNDSASHFITTIAFLDQV
jgi:hypothetical protein